MTHRLRLKLGGFAFALLWTAGMIWHLWPMRVAELGMLTISGALAGLVWYWLYGSWYRRHFARSVLPRRRAS